ncbi:MAG: hypothetical protein M0P71_01160 [Melioribacteraceae bacterium]|nr:hypothetical protein [Melioribacteraceae bacterium]
MIKSLIVNPEFRGQTKIYIGGSEPADGTLFYTVSGVLYALTPPESSDNKALYISNNVPYWDVIESSGTGTFIEDTTPPSSLSLMNSSYQQNIVQNSGGYTDGLLISMIVDYPVLEENLFNDTIVDSSKYNNSYSYDESPTKWTNAMSFGNRTSNITVTTSSSSMFTNTTYSKLVDGSSANDIYFQAINVTDNWIKFNFGGLYQTDMIQLLQNNTSTHGYWIIQGSIDDSNWLDLSLDKVIGGSTAGVLTTYPNNTSPYRYLRLKGVYGTASTSPYIYEFNFRTSETVLSYPTLIYFVNESSQFNGSIIGPNGTVVILDYGDGSFISYTMTGNSVSINHTYSSNGKYNVCMKSVTSNAITEINVSNNTITNIILASSVTSINSFIATGIKELSSSGLNRLLANLVASSVVNGILTIENNYLPTGQGLTDKTTLISAGWTISITDIYLEDVFADLEPLFYFSSNNLTGETDGYLRKWKDKNNESLNALRYGETYPVFQSSNSSFNDKSVVNFQGSQNMKISNMKFSNTPYDIFIVGKFVNNGAWQQIIGQAWNGGNCLDIHPDGRYCNRASLVRDTDSTLYAGNKMEIIEWMNTDASSASNTISKITIDNIESSSLLTTSITDNTGDVIIGANYNNGESVTNGYYGAILGFDFNLNDFQRARVIRAFDSYFNDSKHLWDGITLSLTTPSSFEIDIIGTNGAIIDVDYGDGTLTSVEMTGSIVTLTHSYSGSNCNFKLHGQYISEITSIDFKDSTVSNIIIPTDCNLVNISGTDSTLNEYQVNTLLSMLSNIGNSNGTISIYATSQPTGQGLTDKATLENDGWTITIGIVIVPDIILNFEGADASTTISDSGSNNISFTANYGAKLTTYDSAFGKSSASLYQNTWINSATTSFVSFDGVFTVKFRVKRKYAYDQILLIAGSYYDDCWSILTSGATLGVMFGSTWYGSSVSLPVNEWKEITLTRDNSNIVRMFMDGTKVLETEIAGTFPSTSNQLIIGSGYYMGYSSSEDFLIDSLVSYKGNCLYTADFATVPLHTGDPIKIVLLLDNQVYIDVIGANGTALVVDYGDGNIVNESMTGSTVTLSHTYSTVGTYTIYISGAVTSLSSIDLNGEQISLFTIPFGTILTNINVDNTLLGASKINYLLSMLVSTGTTNGTFSGLITTLPTGQGLTDKTELEAVGWTVNITGGAIIDLEYLVTDDYDSSYGGGLYTRYYGVDVPEGSVVYKSNLAFYGSYDGYITVTPSGSDYLWVIGTSILTTYESESVIEYAIISTAPNTQGVNVILNPNWDYYGYPGTKTCTPQ